MSTEFFGVVKKKKSQRDMRADAICACTNYSSKHRLDYFDGSAAWRVQFLLIIRTLLFAPACDQPANHQRLTSANILHSLCPQDKSALINLEYVSGSMHKFPHFKRIQVLDLACAKPLCLLFTLIGNELGQLALGQLAM
jgi:hypothetical protein